MLFGLLVVVASVAKFLIAMPASILPATANTFLGHCCINAKYATIVLAGGGECSNNNIKQQQTQRIAQSIA